MLLLLSAIWPRILCEEACGPVKEWADIVFTTLRA
jgi:hypothetical protein